MTDCERACASPAPRPRAKPSLGTFVITFTIGAFAVVGVKSTLDAAFASAGRVASSASADVFSALSSAKVLRDARVGDERYERGRKPMLISAVAAR